MSATTPITSDDTFTTRIVYQNPPPDGAPAYHKINDLKTGGSCQNSIADEHDARMEDVREKKDQYTLDTAGFQFFNRPTQVTDFHDDKQIKEVYYPEGIELIKELTGASRVVLFNHIHRLRCAGKLGDSPERRQPINYVHVDQSLKYTIAHVHRYLPKEDAPALLQHRFQIINLWRPIGRPAYDWPLALCDYRSVDLKSDTFPVALVFPDREPGETMAVKHNPKHEWKYLRGMTPDEFVLFKCCDSVQDGSVAVFTPHTSFEDPTTPRGTPPRESIELRALVFYD